MEKNKKSKFFELLLQNDSEELKNHLLSKGKNPKPICPVQFVKMEDNENDSGN